MMRRSWQARSLLDDAAGALEAAGIESARLDAELLMAEATGMTRVQVLANGIELIPSAVARYREFIARRAAREPLAYIVGHKEFFSLDLAITSAVLVPRPETETLVAAALEVVAARRSARVLDIGTGSGAIAIAIAANAPEAAVVASDLSEQAIGVAIANAARLGYARRIEFRVGDCWKALSGCEAIRFDVVVSNPPYVAVSALKNLAPEVRDFEPRIALAAGPSGLEFYGRIVDGIRSFVEPEGHLLVEVGAGQAAAVVEMCRAAGCAQVSTLRDAAGIERVVRARFSGRCREHRGA